MWGALVDVYLCEKTINNNNGYLYYNMVDCGANFQID